MSQSYTWASFEKNEETSYGWCGGRIWDSAWTGCKQNNAVLTLLSGRWAGDHLVWYGCEGFDFDRADTPFKKLLHSVWVDYFYDATDISGVFPDVKGEWRHNEPIGPNGEWMPVYYEGPADTEIRWLRYVVNLDKRQFIDRERAAVLDVAPGEVWRDDLFPYLSVPVDWEPGDGYMGMWFGDMLAATNTRPAADFEDLTHLKSETSVYTDLTNDEILAFVTEGAPSTDDYDSRHYAGSAWYRYATRRLDALIGTNRKGHIVERR